MSIRAIDGLPILDAKHSLPLEIKQSDIDRADKKNPGNCAAAIACRRQHHVAEVRIHLGRVYVRQNEHNWTRYETPLALRAEIIAFDRGGTFAPGTFELKAVRPSWAKERGGRVYRRKLRKRTQSLKKRRPSTIVKDVRTGPA